MKILLYLCIRKLNNTIMTTEITRQDVETVLKSINKTLSFKQVTWILVHYDSWCSEDPTSNWSEIVESMIYYLLD